MALIACKNCGNLVSDKAITCPRCGAPVGNNDNTQQTEQQSNGYNTQQPVEYYYYEEPERKNNTWLIAALVAGIVALLGIGGWLLYENHQKQVEQERQLAIMKEQARQDSIAAAQQREQARQDSIERAMHQQLIENSRQSYINVVRNYSSQFGADEYGWFGYFLYDITQDGVPELWIKAGTCEADFMLYVYTLKNGVASKIYEDGSSHSGYYRGKNYVLQWWAHMGYAGMARITYDGNKIRKTTIYEEDNIESSEDYKEPTEPEIHLNRFDDYSPIIAAIR